MLTKVKLCGGRKGRDEVGARQSVKRDRIVTAQQDHISDTFVCCLPVNGRRIHISHSWLLLGYDCQCSVTGALSD